MIDNNVKEKEWVEEMMYLKNEVILERWRI